jgi:hypothetical protein
MGSGKAPAGSLLQALKVHSYNQKAQSKWPSLRLQQVENSFAPAPFDEATSSPGPGKTTKMGAQKTTSSWCQRLIW